MLTYVQPARNFLQNGIFGEGEKPTFTRSIGYPLFLAVNMKLFGRYWLVAVQILQALLFALFYPLLTLLVRLIFCAREEISETGERTGLFALSESSHRRLIRAVFWFSLISGAYWVRVSVLYTDTFFTLLFLAGLTLNVRAVIRSNWRDAFWALVLLSYAGVVRPSLILFPLVLTFILILAVRYRSLEFNRARKSIIVFSVLLLAITMQLPSLRNYLNYGLYRPTDILENNLLHFLGREVLESEGELDMYRKIAAATDAEPDIAKRTAMEKQSALQIFRSYPLTTLKRMLVPNLLATLASNHLIKIFNFWGYHWRTKTFTQKASLKKSYFALLIFLVMLLAYGVIYFQVARLFVWLWRRQAYLFVFCLAMLIGYFILPTLPAGEVRLRLPVEGILVIMGIGMFFLRKRERKGTQPN